MPVSYFHDGIGTVKDANHDDQFGVDRHHNHLVVHQGIGADVHINQTHAGPVQGTGQVLSKVQNTCKIQVRIHILPKYKLPTFCSGSINTLAQEEGLSQALCETIKKIDSVSMQPKQDVCQSPGHLDSIERGHDHQHRWSVGHPVAAGVHCLQQIPAREIHGCIDLYKLKPDNEHHRKNPLRPEKPLSNVAISYISAVSSTAVLLGCKHKEHDLHRQVPCLTWGQVHNQQQDHVGKLHPHQVNLVQHPQDHHGHLQHHGHNRVLCF